MTLTQMWCAIALIVLPAIAYIWYFKINLLERLGFRKCGDCGQYTRKYICGHCGGRSIDPADSLDKGKAGERQ
ncbi:MAG TPA: hypothetical protein VK663_01830 [Burkholderiales bacterium]|nr:hypothetical protein [Burkholderiales bacterium]